MNKKTFFLIFLGLLFVAGTRCEAAAPKPAPAPVQRLIDTGFSCFRENNFLGALLAFNDARLLDSHQPDAYMGMGDVLAAIGKYNEAISLFKKALQLKPDHIAAMSNLAFAYQRKALDEIESTDIFREDLAVSDRYFQEVSRLDPKYERAYSNWAITLYFQGRYREAWQKIHAAETLGGRTVDDRFLAALEHATQESKISEALRTH